jgi:hypothetical protein
MWGIGRCRTTERGVCTCVRAQVGALIKEINEVLAHRSAAEEDVTPATLPALLQPATAELFASLPRALQLQLLLERDAHGNVAVSQIETEKLLHGLLELRLAQLRAAGEYSGVLHAQFHFFGCVRAHTHALPCLEFFFAVSAPFCVLFSSFPGCRAVGRNTRTRTHARTHTHNINTLQVQEDRRVPPPRVAKKKTTRDSRGGEASARGSVVYFVFVRRRLALASSAARLTQCRYEGRSGLPSQFDTKYCYALGATAAALVAGGHTGMIASVRNLR